MKVAGAEHSESIENYRNEIATKSDLERTDLAKSKTGVFTGGYAVNPIKWRRDSYMDSRLRPDDLWNWCNHGCPGTR